MAAKVSAGLMMFRRVDDAIEVLVAHPGGPFFRRKNEGAWTIPKGQVDEGEDILEAAQREFREETGFEPDAEEFLELGEIRQRSGKVVYGFAFEGDCVPERLVSNTFEMEWPRKSGKTATFPEIDRVCFATPDEARRLLNPAQTRFVDRLEALLADRAERRQREARGRSSR